MGLWAGGGCLSVGSRHVECHEIEQFEVVQVDPFVFSVRSVLVQVNRRLHLEQGAGGGVQSHQVEHRSAPWEV